MAVSVEVYYNDGAHYSVRGYGAGVGMGFDLGGGEIGWYPWAEGYTNADNEYFDMPYVGPCIPAWFGNTEELEPGTYYYRAWNGIEEENRVYCETISFVLTSGGEPIITLPATDLNWFTKTATLNGECNDVDMDEVYFKFDINPGMLINSVKIPAKASFSIYMHGVYQDRLYYFQAVGIKHHYLQPDELFYGDVLTFTLIQDTAADAYVTKLIIRGQPLVPLETMTLTATDAASIAKYGRRTYNLSTQYSLSQDDTQVILNEILADNKNPRVNNLSITFQNLKPGAYKDSVIAADISTRITLINTLLGLDGDFFINNVKHTVTEGGLSYTVQWRLERIYDTTPEP